MATEYKSLIRSTGGQGRYTSLSAWEAAVQNDLTAATIKVFSHGGVTGTISDAASVTGQTSSATGTVVNCSPTQILIKSISGTFSSGEIVRVSAGNEVTISDAGDSPIAVAECYDDWGTGLDDTVQLFGWTVSATNYAKISVASGNRHDGTPQTGFFLKTASTFTDVIFFRDDFCQAEWVDIESTGAQTDAFDNHQNADNTVHDKCIAKASGAGGKAVSTWRGDNCTVRNCLAYDSITAFASENFTTGTQFLNCTAVDSTTGFTSADTNTVVKNCVAYNNTTNWTGSWDTTNSTHNATSTASDDAPGGNSVTSIASTDFADAAANDWHLSSGSNLKDAGTNLTADVTDDIDGDTRSGTWDIGFDEFVSSGISRDPPIGSLTLTGAAPTVAFRYAFNPGAGSLTLTGAIPTLALEVGRFPASGALTLTGATPALTRRDNLEPGAGSLTLAGAIPTLQFRYAVSPATGTLTITGAQPTLTEALAKDVPAGSLTLTGAAPSVAFLLRMEPPAGSITITGSQPDVQAGGDIGRTVPIGSLTITGAAPTVTYLWAVSPAAGALTITGQVPTLSSRTELTPAAGTLTISGAVPTLALGFVITPPAGTLTITGSAPTVEGGAAVARAGGGVGRRRRPRRVMIDGQRYVVRSAAEERELLEAFIAQQRQQMDTAEAPHRAKIRVRVRRAEKRLKKIENRQEILVREEEELLEWLIWL